MSNVITVNFEGVESGRGRIRVPEGDYAMKLKKVSQKKGSDSGEPYLLVGFELSKGPEKGNKKVLSHNFSLQPQSLWNFRNFLEACGKQIPSKKLKIDLDKLLNLQCAGTVIDDEYEGRRQSNISAFFPLEDLGNTSGGEDFEPEESPKKDKKNKGKKKEREESVEEEEEESPADNQEEEEEELFE